MRRRLFIIVWLFFSVTVYSCMTGIKWLEEPQIEERKVEMRSAPGYSVGIKWVKSRTSAQNNADFINSLGWEQKAHVLPAKGGYRVAVGDFLNYREATVFKQKMKELGFKYAYVVEGNVEVPATLFSTNGELYSFSSNIINNVKIGIANNNSEAVFYSTNKMVIENKESGGIIKYNNPWSMWFVRLEDTESGKVWRVKIYETFGPTVANVKLKEYKEELEDYPVYLEYEEPYYLITVGDYDTKEEAEMVEKELKKWGYSTFVKRSYSKSDKKQAILLIDDNDKVLDKSYKGFIIKNQNSNGVIGVNGKLYKGNIEVVLNNRNLITVINNINIDDYLMGVVPYEIGPTAPKEALKAQAIVARSEILAKLGRHQMDGFDFCNTVHCQAYGGIDRINDNVREAVVGTSGLVLMYSNRIVKDAVYSACAGGYTEAPSTVWKTTLSIPYLSPVPDYPTNENKWVKYPFTEEQIVKWVKTRPYSFSMKHKYYRWKKEFTRKEITELINRRYNIGEVEDIEVLERGDTGRIKRLKIIGSSGSIELVKDFQIRAAFGGSFVMYSTYFIIEKSDDKFTFYGAGWGHGVGMDQTGATEMARLGYTAEQILRHYYKGTTVGRVYINPVLLSRIK